MLYALCVFHFTHSSRTRVTRHPWSLPQWSFSSHHPVA